MHLLWLLILQQDQGEQFQLLHFTPSLSNHERQENPAIPILFALGVKLVAYGLAPVNHKLNHCRVDLNRNNLYPNTEPEGDAFCTGGKKNSGQLRDVNIEAAFGARDSTRRNSYSHHGFRTAPSSGAAARGALYWRVSAV